MPLYSVGKLNSATAADFLSRQNTTSSPATRNRENDAPDYTITAASPRSTMSQKRRTSGHKRGLSEAVDIYSTTSPAHHDSLEQVPNQTYRNVRHSLRSLQQAPAASPPATPTKRLSQKIKVDVISHHPQPYPENVYAETKSPLTPLRSDPDSPRPAHHHQTMSHPTTFQAPDFEELNKSSTSYLKTLSKFAQNGDVQEYALSSPATSVVGLHNRRRLKRTQSPRESRTRNYGWGDRNWMDKQRQFLQAYEYLCHIGEAKEWIEDVIQQPIPPIVELEEALRNGVTLAEIVQAFRPAQQLRIFRNSKLQYKHSDNIVLFFRFLEEVGLPELFRFELIDLYEKKNIPKVIHCVHALSWLLYRKGMVDFRIGNLVGQLQFQDHELEQTQKGLEKAGVSMPSFSGMGASFGAEPEPDPVETDEDRIERELHEQETTIVDLQSQMRAAIVRLRLGEKMNGLWDAEDKIIQLQSIIRGDFARQISRYKLGMQSFSTLR